MIDIPTIKTERLRLVAPGVEHLEGWVAFSMSEERKRYVGGPLSYDDAWRSLAQLIGHWALRGFGRWVIEDKTTGAYLGHAGLLHGPSAPEPEITWSLVAAAEGRGVAYEAAVASRRYAYETLGWDTAVSCIEKDNARSITLAERLGARLETEDGEAFGWPCHVYRHPSPATIGIGAAA